MEALAEQGIEKRETIFLMEDFPHLQIWLESSLSSQAQLKGYSLSLCLFVWSLCGLSAIGWTHSNKPGNNSKYDIDWAKALLDEQNMNYVQLNKVFS